MKVTKINFLIIISSIIILEIMLPLVELKLKCEPDHKSIGDNYNCQPDPDDDSEYFYSYEFAHKAGGQEYMIIGKEFIGMQSLFAMMHIIITQEKMD
jgi:hypothetical protein